MQAAIGWPASGANAEFRFKGTKDWALKNFPGTEADVVRATKGLEAREHYRKLRGSLPG